MSLYHQALPVTLEALCSLPNLTNLTLYGDHCQEEFYSPLNAKASTFKVRTLEIRNYDLLSAASSHHLVEALCSLPKLTSLILYGDGYREEFYSILNEKASTLKVKTLFLDLCNLSTTSSSNLAEALCTMPILSDLTYEISDKEFYSALKEKASYIQVRYYLWP
ncbi:uncharacterized protein LOC135154927 [Lytechinus pictus]|uniref:uncharacterized protein LOC135154927 n=1 Tax=Lytechinus pictus TaxID=7653 RepID=UPI0030B9ED45